jgi:hypothetical protein
MNPCTTNLEDDMAFDEWNGERRYERGEVLIHLEHKTLSRTWRYHGVHSSSSNHTNASGMGFEVSFPCHVTAMYSLSILLHQRT